MCESCEPHDSGVVDEELVGNGQALTATNSAVSTDVAAIRYPGRALGLNADEHTRLVIDEIDAVLLAGCDQCVEHSKIFARLAISDQQETASAEGHSSKPSFGFVCYLAGLWRNAASTPVLGGTWARGGFALRIPDLGSN